MSFCSSLESWLFHRPVTIDPTSPMLFSDWTNVLTDFLEDSRPNTLQGLTVSEYVIIIESFIARISDAKASSPSLTLSSSTNPVGRLRRIFSLTALWLHGLVYDLWMEVGPSLYDGTAAPTTRSRSGVVVVDDISEDRCDMLRTLLAPAQIIFSLQVQATSLAQCLWHTLKPLHTFLPQSIRKLYVCLGVRPAGQLPGTTTPGRSAIMNTSRVPTSSSQNNVTRVGGVSRNQTTPGNGNPKRSRGTMESSGGGSVGMMMTSSNENSLTSEASATSSSGAGGGVIDWAHKFRGCGAVFVPKSTAPPKPMVQPQPRLAHTAVPQQRPPPTTTHHQQQHHANTSPPRGGGNGGGSRTPPRPKEPKILVHDTPPQERRFGAVVTTTNRRSAAGGCSETDLLEQSSSYGHKPQVLLFMPESPQKT
eukprot:PhF_6_TR10081/c0_g1_i3/m.15695